MSRLSAVRARWPYFAVAVGVVALDQLTKVLAHAYLRVSSAVVIVPGCFNLSYSRNRGGLFGYFSELGSTWRVLLLTVLPVVAIALIGTFIVRTEPAHRSTRVGLGLILGGAVGNLIDRLVRGEVVDFLDVYVSSTGAAGWLVERFGTAHWPTFNLADSAIVVGAGLLILDMFRGQPASDTGADRVRPASDHGTR
ncbi:MAG TPA: signal peptidase II [Candidatus Polarisedimenticolaceae bacterium]|nr:signal peptidase II [Candidatus Polarisedimenticolaceae bacterium]